MRRRFRRCGYSWLFVSLEGEGVAEEAGAGEAAGERADELDGVDLDSFAVDALGELSSGRAFEHQVEGLTVDRPFAAMSATSRPS